MQEDSQIQRSLIALALVAATAAVFFQTKDFEFVSADDYMYIVRNSDLHDGLNSSTLLRAMEMNFGNWIPLTLLSFHLDFSAYGLEAGGYHITNVILHSLSAVLLFLALSRMTGSIWRSGLVAAIFAIHPIHVESVAWVSERKDTLSGVFWMLTLLAYARYCESPGSVSRYFLVLLFLTLGLMSKASGVTLPFVLLLLDYWPLGRLQGLSSTGQLNVGELKKVLLEKIPMLVLAAGASAITFSVQRTVGFVKNVDDLSVGLRFSNALESYVYYLWDSIWPTGLGVLYPHPRDSIASWSVTVAGLLLVGLTVVVFRAAATRPYACVGWFWFLGTLVPMIGIVQVGSQARADRYMYLPLIGLSILIVWSAADFLRHRGVNRTALTLIASSALISLGTAAWIQTATWRNTESLYRQALSVTDGNYVAHRALGAELMLQERFDEAEQNFEAAARFAPGWSEPRLGLADIAMARGQISKALQAYEDELRWDPENFAAAGRYGLALGLRGRYAEARDQLQHAFAAGQGNAELYRAMAEIEAALDNPQDSVRYAREALHLRSNYIDVANNLAWTLATWHEPAIRNPAEAIRLIEGIARESNEPWLLDTLAAAYAAAGKFELAISTASLAASRVDEVEGRAIRERLSLYRARKPYVAPAPQPEAASRP